MEDVFNIKPKTLFKLLTAGILGAYLPFALIFALLTAFGYVPINFNGEPQYGAIGFIFHLAYTPFLVAVMVLPSWLVIFVGLKISRFLLSLLPNSKSKS